MENSYNPVSLIQVALEFGQGSISVGRLASKDHRIYFEYDADFIRGPLDLSPFRLPLTSELHATGLLLFEGLPDVLHEC